MTGWKDNANVRQTVEAMEQLPVGSPERTALMRELGMLVGGAPDPEHDLAGWMLAVEPIYTRLIDRHTAGNDAA